MLEGRRRGGGLLGLLPAVLGTRGPGREEQREEEGEEPESAQRTNTMMLVSWLTPGSYRPNQLRS